jgi:hypothetical protein
MRSACKAAVSAAGFRKLGALRGAVRVSLTLVSPGVSPRPRRVTGAPVGHQPPGPQPARCGAPTRARRVHVSDLHPPLPQRRDRRLDGSRGDCFDNAVLKSFHASLNKDVIHRQSWRPRPRHARRCSTTSKCSTTAGAATRRSGCCHRWSSRTELSGPRCESRRFATRVPQQDESQVNANGPSRPTNPVSTEPGGGPHERQSLHRGWSRAGLGARRSRQRHHRCPACT